MKKIGFLFTVTAVMVLTILAQLNNNAKAEISEVTVSNQTNFIDAINNATSDYKTITNIYLKDNIKLTNQEQVTISPGKIINIISKEQEKQIGVEDLGFKLILENSNLKLEKGSELKINTNIDLLSNSSISAVKQNSETNDFYAKVEFNDSVLLSASTLNSTYFNQFVVNGALNVSDEGSKSSSIISDSNSPIYLDSNATILSLSREGKKAPSFSGVIKGKGSFVTNTTGENKAFLADGIKVFEGYTVTNDLSVNGNYILYSSKINLADEISITENTNIFVFGDTTINTLGKTITIAENSNIVFNLGGYVEENVVYGSGTNKLILDAGAIWEKNNGGQAAFVTGAYSHEDASNNSRARYRNLGTQFNKAIIAVTETATFNMIGNVILQNLYNTSNQNGKPGAVNVSGSLSTPANFNMYGGKIQYNYLPNYENSGGGAGIAAKNANIIIYDGAILHNSLFNANASFGTTDNSGDGAGISLIENSDLTIHGGQVSYNHGGSSYSADGGGIMVRNGSTLEITDGEISNNFTFGYGGGICVWLADVTINNGIIQGNRANYGGGVALSSNGNSVSTLTIGENEDSNVQIIENEAFGYEGFGGFGGGISIGNSTYQYNQNLTINGGYIANNKATCGGGISNYTIPGTNGDMKPNKLEINGGTITNNTALSNPYGHGIYLSSSKSGNIENVPLITFGGNAKVDSSNNIVISGYNSKKVPIKVTSELTATGIVGLISFVDEDTLTEGLKVVVFDSNLKIQIDKFLLDSDKLYLKDDGGQNLITTTVSDNSAVASVNDVKYETINAAITAAKDNDTVYILRNISLTKKDLITIAGKSITITSANDKVHTLAISKDFDFDTAAINTGIIVIGQGASLTLENIVFDGNSAISKGFSFIHNYGTFILGENAKLVNNVSGFNGGAITALSGSKTEIKGEISGNKGPNGAIYATAPVTIYSTAIIKNNSATDLTFDGDSNLPIGIYVGTGGIVNFVGDGTNLPIIENAIYYAGGSIYLQSALTSTSVIDVYVIDRLYKAKEVIVEIDDSLINADNPISNYLNIFRLVPHNPNDKLGYVATESQYFLIIDRIIEVTFDFTTNYIKDESGQWKKEGNIDNVDISTIDTIKELENLGKSLALLEVPTLRGSTLVVFLHSNEVINLVKIQEIIKLAGHTLTYYLQTNANMTQIDANGTIPYSDDGVTLDSIWIENTYVFQFDKNLSTAKGEMNNADYTYNSGFKDGTSANSRNLPTNKFYAVGFVFAGWYVNSNNSSDIIEFDGAEIDQAKIIEYQQKYGMQITLYARWLSIFGTGNTTDNIGTLKNPFIISDLTGLKNLTYTVSGLPNTSDKFMVSGYPYYNEIDHSYTAFDYADYYFELNGDITDYVGIVYANKLHTIGYLDDIDTENNESIGTAITGHPFSGNFNGNNHTININLNTSSNPEDGVALFGYTKNADISNLTVDGNVSGHSIVAGIIGFSYGGNHSKLTSSVTVQATGYNVGGVIATYYIEEENYLNGSINDVINTGDVSYVGSLINVVHCVETWSENMRLDFVDGYRYGGVIGQGWHLQLTNAYNTGNVKARLSVGGIAGSMYSNNFTSDTYSSMRQAFNIGNVEATAGLSTHYSYPIQGKNQDIDIINAYVGGVVGRMYGAGEISNAANSGNVKASFVGYYDAEKKTYVDAEGNLDDTSKTYSGGRGAGGILGFTSMVLLPENIIGGNKKIDYVYNTGTIEGWMTVGGIAGLFAFSEVNYAINVGNVKATGFHFENGAKKPGGFKYLYDNNYYYSSFLGGIVGMAVGSAILPNAIFDGDIKYEGYTDSIVKAIGDSDVSRLGLPTNTNSARKLFTKDMIVNTNDTKPAGFGQTFYDNHWSYKDYSDGKYYYPQLSTFEKDKTRSINGKTISEYSKESVMLSYISDSGSVEPVGPEQTVDVTLELNGGSFITGNNGVTPIPNGYSYANLEYYRITDDSYYFEKTFGDGTTIPVLDGRHIGRTGYSFDGWYRDSAYTETYDFSNLPSFDITIYAKWTPIKYSITYSGINAYSDGNVTLVGDYVKEFTIENAGQKILLPDAKNFNSANNAYSFTNWQYRVSEVYYNVDSFVINEDNTITLYYDMKEVSNIGTITLDNLEFSLLCTANNFTINYLNIFDGDKGSNPSTYTVKEKITLTNDATRDGYNFVGWYSDADFSEQVTEILAGSTGNINLYAKWEPKNVPLIVDLKGGKLASYSFTIADKQYTLVRNSSGLYQVEIPFGTDISNLLTYLTIESNPTGKTFKGWSTNTEEYIPAVLSTMPKDRLTLFAFYTNKAYTITISAGSIDGENLIIKDFKSEHYDTSPLSENSILVYANYGDNIANLLDELLANIVSNNDLKKYNFLNWQSDPSFSIYNITVTDTELKLEAKYDQNACSVTLLDNKYNILGIVTTSPGDLSVSDLNQYLKEIPGYTFANRWYLLEDPSTTYEIDDVIPVHYNLNLVADYEAKELNVNYSILETDQLLGEVNTLKFEAPYGQLPILSRVGYEFLGWSRTDSGDIINANDLVLVDNIETTDAITLYPILTKKEYKIEYQNLNGVNNPNPSSYTFNTGEITLKALQRKGYDFLGWYLSDLGSEVIEKIDTSLAQDIILYAKWEIQKITVTFDAGAGSFVFFNPDTSFGQFLADDDTEVTNDNYEEYIGRIKKFVQKVEYGNIPISPTLNPRLIGNSFERYYGSFDIVVDIIDRTIYARYTLDSYIVSFITRTDETIDPINVNYNETIKQVLPELTKEGYHFLGWYLNDELVADIYSYPITNNVTFVAKWEEEKYSLTIDLEVLGETTDLSSIKETICGILGVSVDSFATNTLVTTVTYNTNLFALNNLPLTGYYFKGWYENESYITLTTMPARNYNIKAVWQQDEIVSISGVITGYGDVVIILENRDGSYYPEYLPTPTYEGYDFKGWYLEAEHLNKVELDTRIDIETTDKIYAWLAPKQITITYQVTSKEVANTYVVNYGTTLGEITNNLLDGYNYPGYKFNTWKENGLDLADDFTITNSILIIGDWIPVKYGIKFETSDEIIIFEYGQKIDYPTISHQYYNLDWYVYKNDNSQLFSYLEMPDLTESQFGDYIYTDSEDNYYYIELKAVKTPIQYKINFDYAGTEPLFINIGTETYTLPTVQKEHYEFLNWGSDDLKGEQTFTRLIQLFDSEEEITLVPRFSEKQYIIKYEEYEKSFTVNDTTIKFDWLEPSKAGSVFLGYSFSEEATKADFLNSISTHEIFEKQGIKDTYILYAIFKKNEYTVTYFNDDNIQEVIVLHGELATDIPCEPKQGYEFLGWYTSNVGGIKFDFSNPILKNTYLYARYEGLDLILTLEANGGNVPEKTITIKFNSTSTIVVPERIGYTFLGWFGDSKLTTQVANERGNITNWNLLLTINTIYARWELITYYINYDLQGGMNHPENPTTYTVEDTITLHNPTKEGHQFIGWYNKDEQQVKQIDAGTTGNITLFARYEVIKLTVRYLDVDGTLLDEIIVDYGSSLADYRPALLSGLVFNYWTKDGQIFAPGTPIIEDTTLVANYARKQLITTIEVAGETIEVSVQTTSGENFAYDYEIKITNLLDDDSFSKANSLLNKYGKLVYLYDIKIVDSSGNPVTLNDFVRVTMKIPSLPENTTYLGYHIDDDFKNVKEVNTILNDNELSFITDHFSYYGFIIPNETKQNLWFVYLIIALVTLLVLLIIILIVNKKYKISYNTNGGNSLKATRSKAGKVIVMPIPEKAGFTFEGWYLESDLINKANFKAMPRQKITVYAKWKENIIDPADNLDVNDVIGNESSIDKVYNISNVETTTIRKSFIAQLLLHPDLQEAYKEIKNEFVSYKKVKGRISFRFERFSLGRLTLAKLFVRGKRLYLYLALNPNDLAEKYFIKDVSDKKIGEQLPALLRIKSARSIKYAKELINLLMEQNGITRLPEEKIKEVDYESYLKEMTYDDLLANNLITKRTKINQVVEEVDVDLDEDANIEEVNDES